LCVKLAIAQSGISVIEPNQLLPHPLNPCTNPPANPPKVLLNGPVQLDPSGHAGGAPIDVISFTIPQLTAASVPVNPDPDIPPLFVKIVTV